MTGLQIEDWTQATIEIFNTQLRESLDEINSSLAQDNEHETTSEITLSLNIGGRTIQKLIHDNEISAIGETLMTNLSDSLEEYGDSIDATEKMNILIKLIEKYM